jgi:hypothetical protein
MARVVYAVLLLASAILLPWWWAACWALGGIILFPYYFEAVCVAALLDVVFQPAGMPALTLAAATILIVVVSFIHDS